MRKEIIQSRLKTGIRLAGNWGGDRAFSGRQLFRVGEILAVREGLEYPVLGCIKCEYVFGPAIEDPRMRSLMIEESISQLSEPNSHLIDAPVVLRKYCCPNCASIFSADVQLITQDSSTPEMELTFP